jgi:peptide deformylase
MAVRPIVRFPDRSLRAPAEPVAVFDPALQALAADLLDTMRAAGAIGIAAPHIGVPKRLIAIELPDAAAPRVCVNPEIVWSSAEQSRHTEGSISMPGVTEEVERPARVRVRWQDLGGAEQLEAADGMLALCLQHEIDQLDGVFWIHRLSRLRRDRLIRRFEKIRASDRAAG